MNICDNNSSTIDIYKYTGCDTEYKTSRIWMFSWEHIWLDRILGLLTLSSNLLTNALCLTTIYIYTEENFFFIYQMIIKL